MYPTNDMNPIAIRKMLEERFAAPERTRPPRLPSRKALTVGIALCAALVVLVV